MSLRDNLIASNYNKLTLTGYAECYPGMSEMADAIDDSDDEADYSKMDLVRSRSYFFQLVFLILIIIDFNISNSSQLFVGK
jgi:hypothetical protein